MHACIGNLTAEDNSPVSSATVTIKSNGTAVASLKTNSSGWFKASGPIGTVGIFNITTEYAGSTQYLPSTDWEILVVNKAATSIYAVFIPNPVNPGASCALEGVLLDQFSNPIKSAPVSLEYSTDYGLTWHPAGALTTNAYGVFSKVFTAPSSGTYLVRLSYAGSQKYESSTVTTALIVR